MSYCMQLLPTANGQITKTCGHTARDDADAAFESLLEAVLTENTALIKPEALQVPLMKVSPQDNAEHEEEHCWPPIHGAYAELNPMAVSQIQPETGKPLSNSPMPTYSGTVFQARPGTENGSGYAPREPKLQAVFQASFGAENGSARKDIHKPTPQDRAQVLTERSLTENGSGYAPMEPKSRLESVKPQISVKNQPQVRGSNPNDYDEVWEGGLPRGDLPDHYELPKAQRETLVPVRQILRAEGFGLLKETGTLLIRLKPEALGSVLIKLAVRDGLTEVRILAANPLARAMLIEELPMLEQALRDQKINLNSVEVLPFEDNLSGFSESRHSGDQRQQPRHGFPAQRQEQEALSASPVHRMGVPDRSSIDISV